MWVPTGCVVEVHTLTVIAQCWQVKGLTASGDKYGVRGPKVNLGQPRCPKQDLDTFTWSLCFWKCCLWHVESVLWSECDFVSLCHSPLMFYSESSPSACSLSASFPHTSLKLVFAVNASHVSAINERIHTMKCSKRCLLDIIGSLGLSRQCDSFYRHWFDSQTINRV